MSASVLHYPAPTPKKGPPHKGLWVGTSIVVHVVALGAIGLWSARPLPLPNTTNDPIILIDIEPLVLPKEIPARSSATQTVQPDSTSSARAALTTPVPRVPRIVDSQGVPLPAPAPNNSPAASDDRWRYQTETTASAVARGLRTSPIGCAYPERLSVGERQVCAERSTDRAVALLEKDHRISGTGDARRDSQFEAAGRQRMNQHRWRRADITNAETGNVGPSDTPGSNFGMGSAGRHLDPSHQQDAYGPIRTYRREGHVQVQEPPPKR